MLPSYSYKKFKLHNDSKFTLYHFIIGTKVSTLLYKHYLYT